MKVSKDHPCLKGHFPNNPIVPGVLILQLVIQSLPRHKHFNAPQIKFINPLKPEEDFDISFQEKSKQIHFLCSTENKLIAKGIV
jgi:3-hydroxyacyl-[acyl-carrier-protein] dehydratase